MGHHLKVNQPKQFVEHSKNLKQIRKNILKAAFLSKDGHVPSSYSILELLYSIFVLYPQGTKKVIGRDFEFLLSKGHASLGLYSILHFCSFIDMKWIHTFSKFDSDFGGHPDFRKINGVSASTGSLGHGLPLSIGKIFANRSKQIDKNIFCLIGDGELNEGTNWESFLIASYYKFKELTIILDNNKSSIRSLPVKNIVRIAKSFGFDTLEIDGHNLSEILTSLVKTSSKTKFIVANTVKGFGLKTFEEDSSWHHKSPTDEEFAKLFNEIS